MNNDLLFAYCSLWFSTAFVAVALAIGVGSTRGGLRFWLSALLWQTVGWTLLAASSWQPATRWVSAPLGVAGVIGSFGQMLAATGYYLDRPIARRWLAGPPLAAAALCLPMLDGKSVAMPLVCLIIAGQLGWIAIRLVPWHRAEWGVRWRRLGALGYALGAVMVGGATLLHLLVPARSLPAPHAAWSDVFGTIVVNGLAVILLVGTLAFLLAHRDEAERAMQRLASRDFLTDLLNRRAFMDLADRALATQVRAGARPAVMMLDIDHFKRINDTHGHAVGDRVISLFGRVLAGCVGPQTLVDRHGGEEFCLLLAEGLTGARSLDSRFRAELAARTRAELGFDVTFSAGAASADAGQSLDVLIDLADRALYDAKLSGRGRLVVSGAGELEASEKELADAVESVAEPA